MIHKYQSHSLDALANSFISETRISGNSDALEPIWVIVQNNEIKEWLSLQYARETGIAGNFKFIFPSEFLWTLYRMVRDDIPKSLPSDLNAMQWALFDLFNNEPKLIEQIPLSNSGKRSDIQLFYLSAQIADIFDQYQVYRPQMMQVWLNHKLATENPNERWQANLWRRLNEYWNADEVTSSIPSRTDAYADLINWMKVGNSALMKALPRRLHVFGLSQNSRPFLNIVSHIGKEKEVIWFGRKLDVEFEKDELSELIGEWNRSAHEQSLLFEQVTKQADAPSKQIHLEDKQLDFPGISLNSCHSARREAEVLKDAILHYLNDHPEVDAQDILVMVPDADEYAPLLESVFTGNAPELPITKIYGKQKIEEHVLVAILEILNSSFKPSAVLEIMNLSPIKMSFQFTADDLDILEEWIGSNHMHRGIGDSFNSLHSWKKGVSQLIAGLSMQPNSLELYSQLIPATGIESSESANLTARFSRFMQTLMHATEQIQSKKKPVEWIHFCEQLIKDLLQDEAGENNTSSLFLKLAKLKKQVEFSSGLHPVSFGLIKGWLKSHFENSQSSSGRFGQGITVSSYVPYRSIPFKFIAVLGMNEGVFPRRSVRPDFDLIYSKPQPGDRIQKEDDTYLFLETLFAAEDRLYISYKGQDQKTDTGRLPSSLVQQLKEVFPEDQIQIYEHSLHPFSKSYFSKDHLPRSFSSEIEKVAQNLTSGSGHSPFFVDDVFIQPDINEVDQVLINDLISYFSNCSKYIVQNYLTISERLYMNDVQDRESFDLDGLTSYQLSDFLMEQLDADQPKEKMFEYARSAALIPDKLKGEKVFDHTFQQVREMKGIIHGLSAEDPTQIDIDIEIEDVLLLGRISGIHNSTLIISRIGRRKAVHEIEQWLKHLMLLEQGIPIQKSVFVSKEKTEVTIHELHTNEIPDGILKDYLKWFLSEKPVLSKAVFFPESSKKYAEVYLDKQNEEAAIYKARNEWEPSYNRTFVEANDYFNQLVWRYRDPLSTTAFRENALKFWQPFLKVQKASNAE